MKNIQYIIIFTLTLTLGLVYSKIINYENITDELLSDNIIQINKIKSLKSKNSTLQQTIINLEITIKNLDNNLSQEKNNTKILREQIILLAPISYDIDSNDTNNTQQLLENNITQQSDFIEENEITGFN